MRGLLTLLLCLAPCLVLPTLVSAGASASEPTAADKATAKDLMREGKELRDKGDHAGAAKKFAGAWGSFPSPITGLALAQEQIALGQLLEAREILGTIQQMPAKPAESDEGKKARATAATVFTDLVPRIPVLEITLTVRSPGATPTLLIDGSGVTLAAAEQGVRLNPGPHTLTVKIVGDSDLTQTVELHEKERKKLTLEVGKAEAKPPPAPAKAAPAQAVEEPSPSPSPSPPRVTGGSVLRPIGLVTLGVGVAVLGVSGFLGLSAKSSYDEARSAHCPTGACDLEGKRLTDDAIKRSGTATLVLGVGAALAVAGGVLFLVAPSNRPQVGVTGVGVGLGTLSLSGRF
ncbi:MAG: hypothetical protein JNL79_11930 [Myxococcales bacterium]|nr:hypothetical protein [Myxococcales bacterium]